MDLVWRRVPPQPTDSGEKIPWHEPEFSERMLAEHLTQRHDRASRRQAVVEQHVVWLHQELLGGRPSRVVDICCGPGLYTAALARRGHTCTGIDFSPASIRHARECAASEKLDCSYREADVRDADYGTGYELALLIFGELNSFGLAEARRITERCHAALAPVGRLVLEAHPYEAVRRYGQQPPRWYSSSGGLFSSRPHVVLSEAFWDETTSVATRRHFVVDAETHLVRSYTETARAYADEELQTLLTDAGFEIENVRDSLPGTPDHQRADFKVWITRC